jgi:hypothetical protein
MRRMKLAFAVVAVMAAMLALSAGSAMADDGSFTQIDNDVPLGAEVFTFVEDGEDSALFLNDGWEFDDGWGFEDGDDFIVLGDGWKFEDEDDNEFDTVNEGDEESVWQIIA